MSRVYRCTQCYEAGARGVLPERRSGLERRIDKRHNVGKYAGDAERSKYDTTSPRPERPQFGFELECRRVNARRTVDR